MSNMTLQLARALASIDPANDAHWTTDGEVRVDVINAMLVEAGEKTTGRTDIVSAAPLFTRDTAAGLIEKYKAAVQPAAAIVDPAPAPPAPAAAPVAGPAAVVPQEAPEAAAPATESPVSETPAMDRPMAELMASPELLQGAMGEINDRVSVLCAERKVIEDEIASLYAKSEVCSRRYQAIAPKVDTNEGTRAYLAQSNKARMARHKRTQAFLKSGVAAADVLEQTRGASPLDAAFKSSGKKSMGRPDRSPIVSGTEA